MEAKKKVTMQDIAARAGVSVSTVSRVINENALVADETRQVILSAISELNYKPNLFAKGLVNGQSLTIGVLTQLISSPIFDSILRGIMDCLVGTRYLPIFADGSWLANKEQQAMEAFLQRSVDGLIVIGGMLDEDYLVQVAEKTPLILVSRSIPALCEQCIALDNVEAAALATRHLLDFGHRRIAHITGLLSHRDAVDRKEGFLRAMQQAGLEVDPDLIIEGDFTEASGLLAVEMLMTRGRHFSAIFAANDQMAYGARLAFHRRGIRVPQDISIVGFDDQMASSYMIPPLTSIQFPPVEIGGAAARGLINLMQGLPAELPAFPPRLIMRESVYRR